MEYNAITFTFCSDPASGDLPDEVISFMLVSFPRPFSSRFLHNLALIPKTAGAADWTNRRTTQRERKNKSCMHSVLGWIRTTKCLTIQEILFGQLLGLSCVLHEDVYGYLF
jgi:hypothetical protein